MTVDSTIKDEPAKIDQNIHDIARVDVSPRVALLLGIMPRSGTNFLCDLICQHPECGPITRVSEDFLFMSAHLLRPYVDAVHESWNVYKPFGPEFKAPLYRSLGVGMEHFLKLLTSDEWINVGDTPVDDRNGTVKAVPKLTIARSPAVENLDMVAEFTDAKIVIVVRDGRAVVESGMRSFGWLFEDSLQRWHRNAKLISEVAANNPQILCVKYEDILDNQGAVMRQVFEFLDVDPEVYDYGFEAPVRGSSTFYDENQGINWSGTKKTEDFNPRDRWRHWSSARKQRFSWVAVDSMKLLGYEADPASGLWAIYNVVLDVVFPVRHWLRTMARKLIPQQTRSYLLWNRGKRYRRRITGKN